MSALDRKCALENASLVLALGVLAVQDIVLKFLDRYDRLFEVGQQYHSRKGLEHTSDAHWRTTNM